MRDQNKLPYRKNFFTWGMDITFFGNLPLEIVIFDPQTSIDQYPDPDRANLSEDKGNFGDFLTTQKMDFKRQNLARFFKFN